MNNEKKTYESAEIKIVLLDRDMLISSGGLLEEGGWDSFGWNEF